MRLYSVIVYAYSFSVKPSVLCGVSCVLLCYYIIRARMTEAGFVSLCTDLSSHCLFQEGDGPSVAISSSHSFVLHTLGLGSTCHASSAMLHATSATHHGIVCI